MTLRNGQPSAHDMVFPWYYRVYVSMVRWSSGQLRIRRPCHRCGYVHVLDIPTARGAESWEVIAIAYSRAHWARCEGCGATLALAQFKSAQDAFAMALLDRIRRLLSYPNLVDGELAVLTCLAIPL